MFEVFINLKSIKNGKYDSFQEAWKRMYKEICDLLKKEDLPLMMLEQGCWIEYHKACAINFYDSRDLAHECGLMNEKTNEPFEEYIQISAKCNEKIMNSFRESVKSISKIKGEYHV